jgi:hypothetical protein
MRSPFKKIFSTSVLLLLLSLGMISCGDRIQASNSPFPSSSKSPIKGSSLAEVAPPKQIAQLNQSFDQYNPQITIVSPAKDQVIEDTTVEVKIQAQDFPIFKNADLEMGPHIHLILDNEPYQAIYDISQPIRLEHLTPGSHTLRVFAVRPWHESFKNNGAYAQATFHVFSKNGNNTPANDLPLLTYSRPKGEYGAEPILLDFYLTNAPLHVIAQENAEDNIPDWRVRVTINGESFLLDNWQALYLKGFNPGENWVQLEFIDEKGNKVDNVFNNTVRVITYKPNGQDTLSQLVRGELPSDVARTLVDPNYRVKVEPTPEPVEMPEVIPEPMEIPEVTEIPVEIPEVIPEPLEIPEVIPEPLEIPEVLETPPEIPTSEPAPWWKSLGDRLEAWKNRLSSSPEQPAQSPNRKIIPSGTEIAPIPAVVIPEIELPEPEKVVIPEIELPERLQESELEPERFQGEVSPQKPAIPKFILRNFPIFGNTPII